MRNLGFVSLVVAALVGCATDNPGGGDDGGGDDAPPFTDGVSTLSGHAEAGYVDGERGKARFNNPVNVAYGPDGKLYVADFDNGLVRVVDPESGETSTLVEQEGFSRPFGIVFASNGDMFVSTDRNPNGGHDSRSGTIWKINKSSGAATPVLENIGRARSFVVLNDGRIVFSDYQAHVIQIADTGTDTVTVLAGSLGQAGNADGAGAQARFNAPYGMVLRSDGKIVVADQMNHKLRVVGLDGSVTTLIGSSAGYADGASGKLSMPQGIAMASNGDIYISDMGNYRVRRLQGGQLQTVAGNGTGGYADNDDRMAAELYGLEGLSLKPDGSMLFIADGGRGENVPYNRIRSVKM